MKKSSKTKVISASSAGAIIAGVTPLIATSCVAPEEEIANLQAPTYEQSLIKAIDNTNVTFSLERLQIKLDLNAIKEINRLNYQQFAVFWEAPNYDLFTANVSGIEYDDESKTF